MGIISLCNYWRIKDEEIRERVKNELEQKKFKKDDIECQNKIKEVFKSKNGGIDKLKIVKLVGEGCKTSEIAEILSHEKKYIQNIKDEIRKIILDNFGNKINFPNEKPESVIKKFYFTYQKML